MLRNNSSIFRTIKKEQSVFHWSLWFVRRHIKHISIHPKVEHIENFFYRQQHHIFGWILVLMMIETNYSQ